MANAAPSRLGQANLSGDVQDLFLKVFSGEVLASYNTKTVMKDRVRTRKISSGKSAQFPAIGKVGAEYHTPGAEIVGTSIEHGEKVITIDDLLISHTFISNIDEAKNHYEVRAEYSRQMGDALAQTYDRNILSMAVKACRATAETGAVADMGDASQVALGATPTTTNIIDALYGAAQSFDEGNIPEEGRFALVTPAVYYALVQDDKLVNRDYVSGNGDYADGKILRVAGMEIVKTNNLALDHTATSGVPNLAKYDVDASATRALVMHPTALGCVQLMDVASEAEYDIRRQGTLMVSKMAVGHGVLRPEGLIELAAV